MIPATESLPIDEPILGDREIEYLTDCIRSGWVSWQGQYVKRLETEFAAYCQCNYALAMASGTMALLAALQGLRIGLGDEVVVPVLTFSATAFVVSMVGATVCFADCAPGTMTLDPESFERRIGPRTRAVIPVHLYGRPAEMDAIGSIAKARNILVIEDAAQAVGASYHGRRVGSFGDLACFSFHNKLIASGEGGMITTQDRGLAERIALLKTPAPENRTTFAEVSFNFRLSNLHAAVALAQLERLEQVVAAKRKIAAMYDELLSPIEGVRIIPEATGARSVYWRYTILVDPDFPLSRDESVEQLSVRGVQARAIYQPLHQHPYYRDHANESYPVAEDLAVRGLDLPSSPKLTESQIRSVVARIAELRRRR